MRSHKSMFFMCSFTLCCNNIRFLSANSNKVSSANKVVSNFEALGKSLIYNKNSNGPNHDPCGMPHFTGNGFEIIFCTRVH